MSFKQYLPAEVAAGLDETYREDEHWEVENRGPAYFDIHIETIERHEMSTPVFLEFLDGKGLRVLESGCGSGRWMAFVEKLGNLAFGIDDSWGPLRMSHRNDPAMRLLRADILTSPFADDSFDAAVSFYVAEHFQGGPVPVFEEIRRVLKPGGLLFVAVPFDNAFRRWFVNPILTIMGRLWRWTGGELGFTEFRYTRAEMDEFLKRASFETVRVQPDDFRPPWSKGLFCDLCDLGSFVGYEPKPPFEFGPFGRAVAGFIRSFGVWRSCGGILYVARAVKP